MHKYIKSVIHILLVFIFVVAVSFSVHAYSEDFTLPIDDSVWNIENNAGLESLDGWLKFTAIDGNNFPYIYNSSAFSVSVIDVNIVEFEIQFTQVGNFGNGFGIADVPAPPYTSVTGLDSLHNYSLFYIWQSVHNPYLHVVTSLCPSESPDCSGSQLIYSSDSTDLDAHNVVITENNGYYVFNLDDGEFVFESAHTDRLPLHVWGGHPEVTTNSSSTWSEFSVNYVIHNDSLSSPSFPHYSQLDPLWAKDEYDHASAWASEGDREMEEWGCVVSSAAMVLKHYDVNHPDTNEVTNPQNLNNWLVSQPDGYVRNGLTNWLAITRYAHLSELAGYSPSSLEYQRTTYSESSVSASLASDPSKPVIVKNSTSHFFPIYGENTDNWLVSDPLASGSGEIAKTTSLVTANTLTPSHTDLSYMMWVIEPDAVLRLYDSANNLLPTESVIEEIGGTGGASASVQIVYYRQPLTGTYRVEIENPGGDTDPVEMYFYNQEGEVEQVEDELGAGESKGWEIEFDKEGEDIVSLVEVDITHPEIIWDLPLAGALVNGDVMLQVSCDEECDYINFWWRHESESYSNVTPDRRYHYEYDNGTIFGWTLNTLNAERWGGDPSYDMVDGTYHLYAAGKDVSGNWARTSEISIEVDHTSPAKVGGITIRDADDTDLGCDGATNQRRITIDWDDSSESDWDHYLYSIKDKEGFRTLHTSSLTGNIRDLDGEYKYRVKAVDKAGNIGEASEWCKVTLDRLSPTQPGEPTTLPNPTNGLLQSWMWDESVDDGSDVHGYYNRVYNVLSGTYLADWLWLGKVLGTTTDLSDGEWRMVVKSDDNAGNESGTASSETLLVDTIMPVLAGQTSLSNAWYNTPQTVTFQYSDLHLLGSYSDPWCEINIESSSSYCYTTPYVCDTADNCNNTQVFSDSIGLDMTAPSVSMSEWGSRISGTASDSLSGVERVEIRLTKPGESEITVLAVGTTNWSYTIDPSPVGNYQIYITSIDSAGNVSSEIAKNFDINESDPASSPEVLGVSIASFTGESGVLPSPSPSVNPSPTPSPSESPEGDVLGESDGPKENSSYWWWLLILLLPGGWYYSRRRK